MAAAPATPPSNDAKKAAPKARAASPCCASGYPSKIVACEPDEPGTPSSTEGNVSAVWMTAAMPISSANAVLGSIP